MSQSKTSLNIALANMLQRNRGNEDGMFIVAYVLEKETPADDPSDFEWEEHWGGAHGLDEARSDFFSAKLDPKYYAGGIFACIESDVYPTLYEGSE